MYISRHIRRSSYQLHGRIILQTNYLSFSLQANNTDWATATGLLILVPTFLEGGVSRGQRDETPTAVNLSFLEQNPLLCLASSSSFILTKLSGPRYGPTATQKMW
jgi:hypothetical protein